MKQVKLKLIGLPVFLLLGLWLTSSVAFGFDPLRNYTRVELEKLKKQPKTYKNTEVKFRVFFNRIDDMWSPFFSPFSSGDFVSFSGWAHGKHLWKKKEMVEDFPFLFIQNDNEQIGTILSANKFDLIEVKGTVVSAFKSYPWLHVHSVEVLHRKAFKEEQLRNLMLAHEANGNGHPTKATRYYEKALEHGALPTYARAEIHRQLAINYYQSSDYKKAVRNVDQFREYSEETDRMLSKIRERAKKLRGMSPEERDAYEKKRLKREAPVGEETGAIREFGPERMPRSPSRLKKKYKTLLSRYEKLVDANQSLKRKNENVRDRNRKLVQRVSRTKDAYRSLKQEKSTLKKKLDDAYQKNARLLARLHGNDHESKEEDGKRDSSDSVDRDGQGSLADENSSGDRENRDDLREDRLLTRIRSLKRRNRSLRSRMSTLSTKHQDARKEIDRLRDQVDLETSSAERTGDTGDETPNSDVNQRTGKGSESGKQG